MSHPLDGARGKLARAQEHYQALEEELSSFASENFDPNRSVVDIRREGDWYVVFVEPIPHLPVHMSLTCGDMVQNTRTSLDYTVCELVTLRTKKAPDRGNAFPIFRKESDFLRKVRNVKPFVRSPLYGLEIDGEPWTIIKEAQPYNSGKAKIKGDETAGHYLAILGKLSNRDKHRALFVHYNFVDIELTDLIGWDEAVSPIEMRSTSFLLNHESRTEIGRLRFPAGPDPGVHVKGAIPITPSFGEDLKPGAISVSLGLLRTVRERVATLVECFDGFFS